MTILKKVLFILVFAYFCFGLMLYILQRDFIYFPSVELKTEFKTIDFKNGNTTIKVFELNPNKNNAIVYFGGNAENVAYSAKYFQKIFTKHTLYFINYRGYGGSSSKPTEKGLYSDVLFIYDKIKSKHKNINIVARSLGTGVATYLASKQKINRMVLVTPFDSLKSLAQEKFPIYPISIMLKDQYNSIDRVREISAKETLILIASKDTIVPRKNSIKLADAFKISHSYIQTIWEKGHNDIQTSKEYYLKIKTFIENQDDNISCSYSVKATKKNPYSDMLSFSDCGQLKKNKFTINPKHLANLSFQKGIESKYNLTTIFTNRGFFYTTKDGKSLRMYVYDFRADNFHEGVARYIENSKIGFANTKLDIIIKAKYDYAEPFKNQKAIVSNGCYKKRNQNNEHYTITGGLWGAIDKNGKIVIPLKYKSKKDVENLLN